MVNSVDISRRLVRSNDKYTYEYTILLSLNEDGVNVITFEVDNSSDKTIYSFKKDYIVSTPFMSAMINDSKISPHGKFAAFCGDANGLWICRIKYEDLEVASASDDENEGDWEFVHEDLDVLVDDSIEECDVEVAITWKFSSFKKLTHPTISNASNTYNFQYLSWNANETFVAITSDSHASLVLASVSHDPNEKEFAKIKCVLPVAGCTFALAFHPTDPNLLAFSYNRGHVTLLDISPLKNYESGPLPRLPYQILKISVYEDDQRLRQGRPVFTEYYSEITGVKWSDDGYNLYVCCTHRTLVYQVRKVKSLRERCLETLHCLRSEPLYEKIYRTDEQRRVIDEKVKEWARSMTWEPHWWTIE